MRCLVVSPASAACAEVAGLLIREEFRVVEARGQQEGYEVAMNTLPPDIIFIAHAMPEMDGVGLVKTLRSQNRFKLVPLIMFDVPRDATFRRECLDAGATGYLPGTEHLPLVPLLAKRLVRM
jgi:CheY-like chemotaxis protein